MSGVSWYQLSWKVCIKTRYVKEEDSHLKDLTWHIIFCFAILMWSEISLPKKMTRQEKRWWIEIYLATSDLTKMKEKAHKNLKWKSSKWWWLLKKLTSIAWHRRWWIQPQKYIAAPIHVYHLSLIRGITSAQISISETGILSFPLTMNSTNQFAANFNTSGAKGQQSDSGAAM